MTVEVVTLGCRLNAYESEAMRAQAEAAGHARSRHRQHLRGDRRGGAPGAPGDPPARAARTRSAHHRHRLRGADRARALRGHARGRRGHRQRREAARPETWSAARPRRQRENPGQRHHVGARDGAAPDRRHSADAARAFVQVQNGCDHRCTFCIIPYGRGTVALGRRWARSSSRSAASSTHGYREVVLTGVDITGYGADLPGAPTLGKLVRQHPAPRAGACAAAPVLDRPRRGRRRSARRASPTSRG